MVVSLLWLVNDQCCIMHESQSVALLVSVEGSCLYACTREPGTLLPPFVFNATQPAKSTRVRFNGNIDGDMVLNGAVWQRYLLWHPRDHISQGTLIKGPVAGKAEGAWWSIVEFIQSNSNTGELGITHGCMFLCGFVNLFISVYFLAPPNDATRLHQVIQWLEQELRCLRQRAGAPAQQQHAGHACDC